MITDVAPPTSPMTGCRSSSPVGVTALDGIDLTIGAASS